MRKNFMIRPSKGTRSVPFDAGLTNVDFTTPFGFQDLTRGNSASGVRIQDRIDDVAAASLQGMLVNITADGGFLTYPMQSLYRPVTVLIASPLKIFLKELIFIFHGNAP